MSGARGSNHRWRPLPVATPASRQWVGRVRQRMAEAGLSDADVARAIGRSRWEFLAALSPSGHLSPDMASRIAVAVAAHEVRS